MIPFKMIEEQMLLRYVLCDRPFLEMAHTPTYRRMKEVLSLQSLVRTKIPKDKKLYHAHSTNVTDINPKSGVISCALRGNVRYFGDCYEDDYIVYEVNKSLVKEYIYVPDIINYLHSKGKLKSLATWEFNSLETRKCREKEFIVPYVKGLLTPAITWRWE